MLYVYTLFDKNRDSHPLMSGVYDSITKSVSFYTLYLKKSGKTLYEIDCAVDGLSRVISEAPGVMVNDYKQHILALNLNRKGGVYDVDIPSVRPKDNIKDCRKLIATILGAMCKIEPQQWQNIAADAAVVYGNLQRRGVMSNYTVEHPVWSRTYTGRGKNTGFNVYGVKAGELSHPNLSGLFVNFDWVAADMRAVSILSGDPKLNMAFECSDPYQYLVDALNTDVPVGGLTRAEGKQIMFQTAYSFDIDNPAFNFYDGFRRWIIKCRLQLAHDGYLSSVLGRRFRVVKDHTEKSVFNATAQGTIVHAMQLCLSRVWDLLPNSILTENHDSMVLVCNKKDVKDVVRTVAGIMVQPFKGIIDSNPQFPVRVSIGLQYKKWKLYRRYSNYEQIVKEAHA